MDVEAQKEDTPGYDIAERAIFYCSRMLSSQLSVEFTNASADKVKYGNLKKVYSIFICTETAQKKANTIEKYSLKRTVYPKKENFYEPRYDLMEAVIINISEKHDAEGTDNELINLLTDLFNEKISSSEKVIRLKEEYGLPTTTTFEKEVFDMTAYAARLLREGKEEGLREGKKGEKRLASLMTQLLTQKRYEDAAKASEDEDFREKLYQEFGLEEGEK